MPPSVTAVILNFDSTDDTVACVRSLQRATYDPLRIVVVDNGSPGDAEGRMKRDLPGVEVRGTGRNLGYTGGINAGFRFALEQPADYLLALNPDTEVEPGFLEPLVAAMEADPGAAIGGATIYAHHDRTRVWYAGGRLVPWRGLAVHLRKGEAVGPAALGEPRAVSFVCLCSPASGRRTSASSSTSTTSSSPPAPSGEASGSCTRLGRSSTTRCSARHAAG
jgi:GT2 family glycosyltransferase